jgi:MoaA/NifB/PqqE/SkfB family radical SAM enzyme
VLITSLTHRCNLACAGCYARAHGRDPGQELTAAEWTAVFNQAHELGISIILLSGGEPLLRPELLDVAGSLRDVLFPIFTNGVLIDEGLLARLRRHRNLVPIISIEGQAAATDQRRGAGVYQQALAAMRRLQAARVFFGASLTITKQNFEDITHDDFIRELVNTGGKLFYFIEYVPIEESTAGLVLAPDQKALLENKMTDLRQRFPGVFVAFPGDEEQFGGCLGAGRGFVHIGPDGSLEPCPFAPFTDVNVRQVPLQEALQSQFLQKLRESPEHLSETRGGCALWANREWVRSLLSPQP